MTSSEIRKKYLEFFEKNGHKIIPSSSLVPENDSSVLFTTAGMQQFKPYYIGKKNALEDFGSLNVASVQKCVRTSDIEEVGDERHLTFFEMLGNFSFGGYWKEEAIKYAHEFITSPEWMNLKIDYVSVFEGEDNVPADLESEQIWKSIDPNIVIKKFGRADNFWGPTGEEGPCGPTTEIYVDGIEIWNIVFNEFYQNADKTLRPLEIKGIDTGMGLERLVLVSQFPGQVGEKTIFETDLFSSILQLLPVSLHEWAKRIVVDHIRTTIFLIEDGIVPSNKERGYILRRILRRMIIQLSSCNFDPLVLISQVIKLCGSYYKFDEQNILNVVKTEVEQFQKTLAQGRKELEHLDFIDASKAFKLYESYGLPFEVIKDLGGEKAKGFTREDFDEEFKKHQELSRIGSEQKFKGGLGGHSEMEVKYHTATHLLLRALRDVLGEQVSQKGSNITAERLRFDFNHDTKLTEEEKKKVEEIVNQKIQEKLSVQKIIMKKEEAEKTGASHAFGDKYGDEVSVYYIGENLENAYSKEFCGGPHIENTGDLGVFKIIKEEAVSAGVRRIKAKLEN